jgi:hypothetical protein
MCQSSRNSGQVWLVSRMSSSLDWQARSWQKQSTRAAHFVDPEEVLVQCVQNAFLIVAVDSEFIKVSDSENRKRTGGC